MCNRMPPKVWGQNLWQSKYFVNCVCVLETKSAPNRKPANNQASAEYNTSSEVGIPILKPQMDVIMNVGHGHQSYTVDPCRQIYCIATKNTLWIYARRLKLWQHSHMTYKVDLWVSKSYIFHHSPDQKDETQGLQSRHLKVWI
jgi:hypothetical protein